MTQAPIPADGPIASSAVSPRFVPPRPGAILERLVVGIYDEHRADLLGFARALARDADAAEDLVAEGFARLIHECREGRESDGATWWIDEVRTSDAGPAAKWATFPRGRLAVTPLGRSCRGDLTASGVGSAGPVDLAIRGMVLSVTPQPAFVAPPGGGQALRRDPFAGGGALHCSRILQLTPRQAQRQLRQFRLSWRWQYKTGPESGFAEIRLAAPAGGVISGTAVGSNGELVVFVEDPARPLMAPATFPADCPAPPGP